ncbi:hypothetical protein B5G34_14770 [Flavonifractor sp. An82]|uniref:YczE/YyaS/YitT family protein n=1 Tax=Flavonifractor sp. An82 TaxID=1965660 RepID=UPI000B39A634|nr:DUF6198 family protein [Flavonifractor sp. An82]OUN20446.1 hypothetical protein B5G34_14770 [Flavonifractor sp. An82]
MEKEKQRLEHIPLRLLMLLVGFGVMAFGVAFSIKGALGTSPISSVPYVTGYISGLSVGTTTIIMNGIFVLLQIAILRRRYQWVQLLQFPAAIVFGLFIDGAGVVLQGVHYSNYLQQWVLCAIGIVLVGLGVSIEVTARLVTTAGEGVVLAICQVAPVKFGNMKVIFDVTLVCISIVTGLVFLGRLEGVREGTVAAAICVGLLAKWFSKPLAKFEQAVLCRR